MPPRTTRKSYRPRVSDRTMVGTLRPHCLFASETEGRRHANEMNLRNRENHGSSLQHMGWMAGRISPLPPVEGEAFFLTSPFIEPWLAPYDHTACLRQKPKDVVTPTR